MTNCKDCQQFRKIGYYEGKLSELKNHMIFTSLNWWVNSLLGVTWGLIIASWVIVIFK